jgi:predicted TIM-barrel fold metal-dependent hydrolase
MSQLLPAISRTIPGPGIDSHLHFGCRASPRIDSHLHFGCHASPRIDSHLHFGCHERLGELDRYAVRLGLERLCLLSLPDRRRINFNPELITAKAAFPRRCYILGSFDYSSRFHPAPGAGSAAVVADRQAAGADNAAGGAECAAAGAGRDAAGADLDLAGQVETLRELGFDGLKLWEGKPAFQREVGLGLADPPLRSGLEAAARLGMPACVHVGDPPEFWKGTAGPAASGAGSWPPWDTFIGQAESLADAHPRLTLIFPHLLFLAGDLERLARLLRRRENVWVDLSPGNYMYAELSRRPREAQAFFLEFQDRILFGSDSLFFPRREPVLEHAPLAENLKRFRRLSRFLADTGKLDNPFAPSRGQYPTVRGLGLPAAVLRKIGRENTLRLFGGQPAALNRGAAAAYLEGFRRRLAGTGGRPEDLRALAAQIDAGGR